MEAWFRDFNDAIHEHRSRLDPKDDAGRKHLDDLMHVCWLFRKGMEHYAEAGDAAQIDIKDMEDKRKQPWWKGAIV